jgi:hemerythrin superfamily protein
MKAAKSQKKTEYVHLTEKIILHAQSEEGVLYPASTLIGEYVYLKLKAGRKEDWSPWLRSTGKDV